MFGSDDGPTDLQQQILNAADLMGHDVSAIASECNCSESYVRETLREYR